MSCQDLIPQNNEPNANVITDGPQVTVVLHIQ